MRATDHGSRDESPLQTIKTYLIIPCDHHSNYFCFLAQNKKTAAAATL
jgi:hypothetical protein